MLRGRDGVRVEAHRRPRRTRDLSRWVVALEKRIIHLEGEYPGGEAFWEAVGAFRERGAYIPEYEPLTRAPRRFGLGCDVEPV